MEALRQIDGWDVPFAAAGVTDADGDDRDARRHRVAPSSSPRSRSPSARSRRSSPRRKASSTSTSPPGRPARRCATCSPTPPGCPFEGSVPIAPPGPAPHLLERGLRRPRRACRRAGRDAVRRLRARGGLRAARPRARPRRATRARACTPASTTCSRFGRELLAPRLVAPETHDEMVAVQFPGLDGVLPEFGRFSPLDWGLGVELKGDEAGSLVGLAHLTAHVRSLRRQRHVPLGRPRPRHRVRRADDEASSATGRRPAPGRRVSRDAVAAERALSLVDT